MTPSMHRVEQALGSAVVEVGRLSGGCIADTRRIRLADGRDLVAKLGKPGDQLDLEGRGLTLLKQDGGLPTPQVYHASDDLLIMAFLDNTGSVTAAVEQDAAQHMARLHDTAGPYAGLDHDNRIGPLPQANTPTDKWVSFFRDHRLLRSAGWALERGSITPVIYDRAERVAASLERWIDEPSHFALLHGDLWSGNVLTDGKVTTGFIDPAVYYGDPEMDLALPTLFGPFGESFFDRYAELRPFDRAGFFDLRRDIYLLYALFVHAALFGPGYGRQADTTLRKLVG